MKITILDLAYIGQLLGGISVFVLIYDLYVRNRKEYKINYNNKIQNTIYYVKGLPNIEVDFGKIYSYLQDKRDPTKKVNDVDYRLNIMNIYLYLKEINIMIKNNFIDVELIREALKSYKLDINNFFQAAYAFLSFKELLIGKVEGFRGDFTHEDLDKLKIDLKRRFDFIE